LSDFNAVANTTEQQLFSSTVSGLAVDLAAAQEDLVETTSNSATPLTHNVGLTAASWYKNQTTTIGDTSQLAAQVTAGRTP
jgi:hypothetical protein